MSHLVLFQKHLLANDVQGVNEFLGPSAIRGVPTRVSSKQEKPFGNPPLGSFGFPTAQTRGRSLHAGAGPGQNSVWL